MTALPADDADRHERRARLADQLAAETGITEPMIADLVDRFYARVRDDALLAPVFARVDDWDAHLARLRAFWSSVTLMSGRYHGQPMRAHLPLGATPAHFDRWLALFEDTAREVCPPKAATVFLDKARRIADSFEMAMASHRGDIAAPRHAPAGRLQAR